MADPAHVAPAHVAPAHVDSARVAPTAGPMSDPAQPESHSETAIRWGNLVIWSFVTLFVTLFGILLIPWTTSGGTSIPVAPLVPLVANFLLPRMMLRGTDWGWSRFVPAVIFIVLTLVGSTPSSGGDLLIPTVSHSSAIGLGFLAAGAMSAIAGIAFAATDLRSFRRRRGAAHPVSGSRPGGASD